MNKPHSDSTKHSPPGSTRPWVGVTVIVLAIAALVVITKWPARQRAGGPVTQTNVAPAQVAAAAEAKPNLDFLKGRWVRPDGGYVLEIRTVDADGQMDAGYFNPSPIRVTSATARKDGAAIKVFIELNDVNYPGCKYNLTHIPERDILVGTYFQAAMRETFDVTFEREN